MTWHEFKLLVDAYTHREEREFYRAGIICSVIANVNSSKGKKYQPKDFMPKAEEKPDMAKQVEALNAMFGGVDKRGGKACQK